MPRYFFHFIDSGALFEDEEGEFFSSSVEAQRHARLVAWELGKNSPQQFLKSASVLLMDEQGTELMQVPLHGATEPY